MRLWAGSGVGGDAQGDTLSNIPNLVGSGYGDLLIGDFDVDNLLVGGEGNDTLSGLSGADRLIGGAGDDSLQGGNTDGAVDVYVFAPGDGADTVSNFTDAEDILEFTGGILSASQLTWSQQGADVLVTYGTDDTVLVEDTTIAALSDHIFFA